MAVTFTPRCRAALAVATALAASFAAVPGAARAADAGRTPGADPAAARTGDRAARVPADVLDLRNWKLTLPIGKDEHPTEITQPKLATYSNDPYFTVAADGTGVQFRAPVNGVTTGGSKNPRSELREMKNGGKDKASWSAKSGTHTLTVREAFTHLPKKRPYVVGAQIHGGDDDVTVFRLEGTKLYITEKNTTHHRLVTDDYKLGTVFEAKFVVAGGKIKAYYNGELQTTISYSGSGNYFKAGAYTQAHCGNTDPCDSGNYGETVLHGLTVKHDD
ncbi:polysaccharide lyase family 7 protein [Streptomyces sp. NPDC057702]|uniref:polysaccharide lyase family 7 protein n=1 Tax=unclassified Streptomyces TaxID=2593676 RepID=UPI0036849618